MNARLSVDWTALLIFSVGILCPGAAQLAVGKTRQGSLYFGSCATLLIVFVLTRAFYHPPFAIAILLLYSAVYLFAVIQGVACYSTRRRTVPSDVSGLKLAWGTVVMFLTTVTLAVACKAQVLGVELYRINAYSMHPTLQVGQLVIADTWFRPSEITQGDIVFFSDPAQRSRTLVKRVVGLPGHTVSFTASSVKVADKNQIDSLKEAFVLVEPLRLFMAGDNERRSRDSRHFGTVPLRDVHAKAVWLITADGRSTSLFTSDNYE